MSKPIVTPAALGQTNECTITPPWVVQKAEYAPVGASFKPLINGERAFRAVYEAIVAAEKSVCIICWGFQPSMYFIRESDPDLMSIGKLLEKKAEAGIKVRVLCFAFELTLKPFYLNVTGVKQGLGESNTPGRHSIGIQDRPAYSDDAQYQYDCDWFNKYDENQEMWDVAVKLGKAVMGNKRANNLRFFSRGFSSTDRARIAGRNYEDQGLSGGTKTVLAATPSHHQKMVLVDYETPNKATGFVMGHNMLDEYWDKDNHSYYRQHYKAGRNGVIGPRQDISSRVTGPVVGNLFSNFSQAWEKETGESLGKLDCSRYPTRKDAENLPVYAQILRTQPQYGIKEIKDVYMQAINNASTMIYAENQYFRWPPLAEKIKEVAQKQTQWGCDPGKHDALYLFVTTNSTDDGVGSGTVNTYRMLDSLGRADTIPNVARSKELDVRQAELKQAKAQTDAAQSKVNRSAPQVEGGIQFGRISEAHLQNLEELNVANQRQSKAEDAVKASEDAQQRAKNNGKERVIAPKEVPGLKMQICTLVAPDSPAGKPWLDVYIHAKLLMVNDSFTTLGSTNINTRSMEVDSELNIAFADSRITKPMRQHLWGLHTNGMGAQDEPAEAFKKWDKIIKENKKRSPDRSKASLGKPYASLVEFYRGSTKISDSD
ncbi:hypothetical protein R6242_06455 [Iodobacter sp. CM08]|uniref:phospholipase D-like domain-containing protein n=1 Tax=Iodobacter sp. CM08 TaxID=3085902 RepID=UPI0029825412|nr:phospholipase D-like domain-containing protein [Iodobacter sp. CM08]MDW5416213.1 hypothetical protein [Iodobacter sp. CM08]